MFLPEIIPALLFLLSSGLLFNERYRNNLLLVTLAGAIALISSYFLIEQITERIIANRLESSAAKSPPAVSIPTPANKELSPPAVKRDSSAPQPTPPRRCITFNDRQLCE